MLAASSQPYSLLKDDDKNYDAKGKRWKSSKDHDYGDDDQEDVALYCCWCCKVASKSYSDDQISGSQGCSRSMEGSTMRRHSIIQKVGPEYYSFPAVKGIKNLGNTCYLNSVLQCLNQTVEFHKLLSDGAHPAGPNQNYYISSSQDSRNIIQVEVTDSKLGCCGKELYYFIHQLSSSESPNVVKPSKLLSRLRQKADRFQGSNPQDSHEIFRVILDCIRSEEFEAIKDGIFNFFNVTKKSFENCEDEETKTKIRGYLSAAEKRCRLLKVFTGSVINMIVCRECNTVLKMHEEVLDFSIPAQKVKKTLNCYDNSYADAYSSSYFTTTEDTNIQYVDADDQVNILSKSPTYTLARSHQSGSHRSSRVDSQCEMELSIRAPKTTKRFSPMHTLTKSRSLSKSLDNDAKASYSDSVRTEIIRIPQVPPISEDAISVRSVDKNTSVNNSATMDHSGVCSPVSTSHYNSNFVSHDPDMLPTDVASETGIDIGNFSTNEQKLQLYLKRNNFPYRVMRCDAETDLEAGLQAYFELDVLDDNNKFICDTCTAKRIEKQGYTEDLTTSIGLSKVSKQLSIASLPEILVLQIKRFSIGYKVTKYTESISFPLILNMAPYCTNECLKVFADSTKRVLYGLYGVIEHRGHGLLGGHYVAYLRRRERKIESSGKHSHFCYNEKEAKSGEWFLANDQQIKKVPDGFDGVKGRQAYILFYERLPITDIT